MYVYKCYATMTDVKNITTTSNDKSKLCYVNASIVTEIHDIVTGGVP